MDTSPPQDFIAQQVAQPRNDALIHEHWLELTAMRAQPLFKLPPGDGQGIRTLLTNNPADGVTVRRQPDALQLAHVVEAQLSVIKAEDHAVMPVTIAAIRLPLQPARHAEVEQDGGAIRAGEQPFPSSFWSTKAATLQHLGEMCRRGIAHALPVADLDVTDHLPDAVVVQRSAKSLDIRELRQWADYKMKRRPI